MMDFEFSDEQNELRAAARALLERYCPPLRVREMVGDGRSGGRQSLREQRYDAELWRHLVNQGWVGVELPVEAGGGGMGSVETCMLLEEIGRSLAPVPYLPSVLALGALHRAGATALVAELIEGRRIGCVAFENELAVGAPVADLLVRIRGDDVSLIEHLDVEALPAMDRTRPVARTDHVSEGRVIGDDAAVDELLDRGAVGTAAQLLGGASAMLEAATEYAKNRQQFGRPIGSFQAIKHHCADMLVDVECMRSVLYWAAWCVQEGTPDRSIAASSAKAWCADAAVRVIETAIQVFGGIGFTWEHDGHLYLKRAQLDEVTFGTARFHRDRLARLLREQLPVGLPLS
jgi:alkylation response protein AidB-like acyl-CoA dehydrogenase